MIPDELRELLRGPHMLIVAAPGCGGGTQIGRAMGAGISGDEFVVTWVSAWQWPDLVKALGSGAPLSLTITDPETYRGYQTKGRIRAVRPASSRDRKASEQYIAETSKRLRRLGIRESTVAQWFSSEGLMRIEMEPLHSFTQTPGPSAGKPMPA